MIIQGALGFPSLNNPLSALGRAAAVIASARRRQRRRRIAMGIVTAVAALSLGVFAVLFGHDNSTRQVSVRLYLDFDAKPGATTRVLAAARSEHGVVGAKIFSKEAALATLRQRYPSLARQLKTNPFSNAIDVRLADRDDATRLIADLKARALPVIARVTDPGHRLRVTYPGHN